jgi:hypothetical protein
MGHMQGGTHEPTTPEGAFKKVATSIKLAYGFGDPRSNKFIVTPFLSAVLPHTSRVKPRFAVVALLFPNCGTCFQTQNYVANSDRTRSRWGRRSPISSSVPALRTFVPRHVHAPATSPRRRAPCTRHDVRGGMYGLHRGQRHCYSSKVAEMSDDYNDRMSSPRSA